MVIPWFFSVIHIIGIFGNVHYVTRYELFIEKVFLEKMDPEIHNTGIGNGVDSVDFIETFRVIVFHAR